MAFNLRNSILTAAIGFCLLPSLAMAGADPAVVRSPAPEHHFFDARNVATFSMSAAIMVADIATTQKALQVPGAREANPMMSSPAAVIPLKVASVGAGIGLAYLMHRSGHHKAERFIPMLVGVPSALAALHNAGIHQ